jgi:hypothetical protein
MDDGGRLHAFLQTWPPGAQLTTRGLQVLAGFASLAEARAAAEQACARGLLAMETIGATRLWRPRDSGAPHSAVTAQSADAVPA